MMLQRFIPDPVLRRLTGIFPAAEARLRIVRTLCIAVLVSIVIAAVVLSPPDLLSDPETVDVYVSEGMSSAQIGLALHEAGLIRDPVLFAAVARVRGVHRTLKSGHYRLRSDQTLVALIDTLARGEVYQVRVTIPEGYGIEQIASLLESKGLADAQAFVDEALSSAADYAHVLGFRPPTSSLEGYLFPDTYFVSEGLPVRRLISMMVNRFREKALPALSGLMASKFTVHELVTLASIIEREAARDSERPLVSSVFHNRLASGIPLQSCATVQYVLGEPGRTLTRADLAVDSPYNTYLYRGLPPGPVANPGLPSLAAAANPADTPYMFFVADGSGGHVFSVEYPEHLAAAENLRQLRGD
ncbi:MAG: endolytic transglycosylase MltG [Firmicutes bacterium]|nr:endolytic transglycosylase MltG [Bacillota bacterium]